MIERDTENEIRSFAPTPPVVGIQNVRLEQWLARNGGPLPGETWHRCLERLQEPTQQWCDATGLSPHADGATHHLVPRPVRGGGQEMRCARCDRTERELREAAVR